ncbi:MAG: ATP-binding protein [Actinomycetota bacterium]
MQPQNPNQPSERVTSTSELPGRDPLTILSRPLNRMVQWFSKLSISNKIRSGYALALGVAIGGTSVGLITGNYYYQKASKQVDVDDENRNLRTLETVLLRAQADQQRLIYLLNQPEQFPSKYDQLQKRADSLNQLLSQLKTQAEKAHVQGFQAFIENYEQTLTAYLQKLQTMLGEIATLSKSQGGVKASEQLLSELAKDPIGFKLDLLVDELATVISNGDEQEDLARQELTRAELIRAQIIIVSMAFSSILAALLATYTSRAIAHPLKTVTQISQQVTADSNFDLQAPITNSDEVGALATSLNQLILKVKNLLAELHAEKELQLIQSEKMASLGRMLAGVAHEINNPINFIYGNLNPAQDYLEDIFSLLAIYEAEIPNPPAAVQEKIEEIDLDFVKEDLLKLLQSMKVGAERAKAIILSLKDFSRLDQAQVHPVDLHACLETTLLILNNRIKKGITVIRNYGEIPPVEGYMGLLYQVFMNILSNALDALEEVKEMEIAKASKFSPTITITTESLDRESVVVRIMDNGTGIAPTTKEKMFQTFFTTKPRGIGTGLGLAISRNIIVEKHSGTINYWSEMGLGTEFIIALPIKQQSELESRV